MDNLKLVEFNIKRDAILETEDRRQRVSVSAAVLKKAFITRAWLDRTLIDCALGKCRLGAHVRENGRELVATEVWLALEKNIPSSAGQPREMFKNFGLELHKPRLNADRTGTAFFQLDKLEDKSGGKLARRFKSDNDRDGGDLCNFRFDNDLLQRLDQRQTGNAAHLAPAGVIDVVFTPDWRLVLGMGEASVYETHLTLHHTYGFPYIPASSIKGALRHYVAENAPDMVEKIFGENDQHSSTKKPIRGQCIFFDAFPLKAPRVEVDVITPHYPDYYSKGQPPADWQSPNPIHFLTVGHGTPFRFLIGLPNSKDMTGLGTQLGRWLKNMLEERGLGAKTAVGYGYWQQIG